MADLTASMTAKRTALAAGLTTTLAAIEAGWTVSTRFQRGAGRPGGDKAERDRVMGSPIRYARLAHIGSATLEETGLAIAGQAAQASHTFAVYLWRQYADTDANQTTWDSLTEGVTPDGVLTYLRSLGGLTVGTHVVYVGQPEDVIIPDEPEYLGDEDYAWYCQFFITLT